MKSEVSVETGSNSQGNSPSLATVLSQLNWGGAQYPQYEARCEEVAAGAGTGAGTGAGAGAGDGGAGAAAAGGPGTSSAAAGSPPVGQNQPGSPAGNGGGTPNDENIRVLRQSYETLKPWEKVAAAAKDPGAVLSAYQSQQKLFTAGQDLAKKLGYTEESFKAAFDDDPVDTITHLRAEFAKNNPGHAQNEAVRKAAEEAARVATKPITEQLNKQQTEVAMAKYDGEFNRLISDDKLGFGKDVPKEIKDAMYDLVDQLIPEQVLVELKTQGKISGVQAAFDQAKGILVKVVNAYNAMQVKQVGAGAGNGAGNGNGNRQAAAAGGGAQKVLTLDDIIADPTANLPGLRAGKY